MCMAACSKGKDEPCLMASHMGLLTILLILHEWFLDQYRAEDDEIRANNSKNAKLMMEKELDGQNNGQIMMMVAMDGK